MMFSLVGHVALVTGGDTGIGRAIAAGFAAAGASVNIWVEPDRSDSGAATREQLTATGCSFSVDTVDLAVREQIEAAFDRLDARGAIPSIWVNNAGVILRRSAEQVGLDEWERVNSINLSNLFLLCREASRRMIPHGTGVILNVASVLSFGGGATVPVYAISKGGVRSLTYSLAASLAKHGIRVNAVAPGHTRTPLTEPAWQKPESRRALTERIPLGRWGQPDDIVGAALFLCSDAGRYVTGHVLAVDGGWLAD
jgi:2-deoxy-D-gluconate 3-dehydrogenase